MAKLTETITVEIRRIEALAIIGAEAEADFAEPLSWVQKRIYKILTANINEYDLQLLEEAAKE